MGRERSIVRKMIVIAVLIVGILFGIHSNVMAKENSADYKQLVKAAFHTQVALSEKERSINEIRGMLSTYFTKDFISLFLEENLVKTDNGYQTFGSDFPLYYIPFFTYNDNTKVKRVGNRLYIYENMSKKDGGPVIYKNDYQGVRLKKTEGEWKIDEILYSVPKNIIQPSKSIKKHQNLHKATIQKQNKMQLLFIPLTSFILSTNIKPFWLLISKL